jgi:hypothetical protein
MTSKVIALAGHMGSGKDTAAEMIIKEFNGSKSYAFADHLKKIAIDIFNCTQEEVYGEEKEKQWDTPKVFDYNMADMIHDWVRYENEDYDDLEFLNNVHRLVEKKNWEFFTSRALQQFLGTELLRDCYSKEYHIMQVVKRIQDDQPTTAVITDARFPNEREWAKNFGASTVLLQGRTRVDFNKDNFNKHASETGLGQPEDYDFVIDNSGTLQELQSNIFNVVNKTKEL